MGRLTTHVLDIAQGSPAHNMAIELWRLNPETGQRTLLASSLTASGPWMWSGAVTVAISVSGVVSSPQPTASSYCLVEWGSVKICEQKNSTKS